VNVLARKQPIAAADDPSGWRREDYVTRIDATEPRNCGCKVPQCMVTRRTGRPVREAAR
jgi:hypothetical protein